MSVCRAWGLPTGSARRPRCLGMRARLAVIDEFGAEFATDPPCQPTMAPVACPEYEGELSGNVEIFGDDPYPAIRNVRDGAIARQRADPELDFRDPSVWTTFASASIRQHLDPSLCPDRASSGIPQLLPKDYWNRLSWASRNVTVVFELCLPGCSDVYPSICVSPQIEIA